MGHGNVMEIGLLGIGLLQSIILKSYHNNNPFMYIENNFDVPRKLICLLGIGLQSMILQSSHNHKPHYMYIENNFDVSRKLLGLLGIGLTIKLYCNLIITIITNPIMYNENNFDVSRKWIA
jgi:hypothetical protein